MGVSKDAQHRFRLSSMDSLTAGEFAAETGVSRETLARLKAYADILADWNARHNLVAKSTLPDLWRRHFWDSAQLVPLIPEAARTLADLGSGGICGGRGTGGS